MAGSHTVHHSLPPTSSDRIAGFRYNLLILMGIRPVNENFVRIPFDQLLFVYHHRTGFTSLIYNITGMDGIKQRVITLGAFYSMASLIPRPPT